jgi:prefoldin subunit 5
MAMEEAASIIGATKEELDLIRENFKQHIRRLYIKYNTSVIYQTLKQVSF